MNELGMCVASGVGKRGTRGEDYAEQPLLKVHD